MGAEFEHNEFLKQALEGVDLSILDQGREKEYPTYTPEQIIDAESNGVGQGVMMWLGNMNMLDAKDQAEGRRQRVKKTHEIDWKLSLQTPRGIVGLSYSWSRYLRYEQWLYLGFPRSAQQVLDSIGTQSLTEFGEDLRVAHGGKLSDDWSSADQTAMHYLKRLSDLELRKTLASYKIPFSDCPYISVPDELIIDTLGVERAKPVQHVSEYGIKLKDVPLQGLLEQKRYDVIIALACNELHCSPDKLKAVEIGHQDGSVTAYYHHGEVKWGKFYGPIEPTAGRVWIENSGFYSYAVPFSFIEKGRLRTLFYGHHRSNGIYNQTGSFFNEYAPEGPTAAPEAVREYRDKFIKLAAEIAFIMGGPKAVNIDFGYSMVPEDLYREEYEIKWLKGDLGERTGWGREMVQGRKGDSTVIIKSGDDVIPWQTILRVPINRKFISNPTALADFIKEDLLWF